MANELHQNSTSLAIKKKYLDSDDKLTLRQ